MRQEESSIMRNKEEWKQVTAWSSKRNYSLASQLLLRNRYEALGMADEGLDEIEGEESVKVFPPRSDESTTCVKGCIKTSTEKKQQQVMVIGDSLLSRTEAPVCILF